jgi:hypothetical protein
MLCSIGLWQLLPARSSMPVPHTPFTRNTCLQAKQERLRQAKAEAEREIAAYKAEREGAYQKKLAEVRWRSVSLGAVGARVQYAILTLSHGGAKGWRAARLWSKVQTPLFALSAKGWRNSS